MIDPRELADLYGKAHDALTALGANAPRDVVATWPNTLGFLRRVAGQPYHRAAPNGRDDEPTEEEKGAFRDYLRITLDRCERCAKTA
jgi:hypothetical protein